MHMQKVSYTMPMRNTAKFLVAGAFALAMVQVPAAQQQAQSAQPQPQTPVFGSRADLVTTDVIVRDQKSAQFIADLKPGDAIIVLSTVGANTESLTAITLLAGVEPILTRPGTREMSLGGWSLGAGGGGEQ